MAHKRAGRVLQVYGGIGADDALLGDLWVIDTMLTLPEWKQLVASGASPVARHGMGMAAWRPKFASDGDACNKGLSIMDFQPNWCGCKGILTDNWAAMPMHAAAVIGCGPARGGKPVHACAVIRGRRPESQSGA